MAGRVWNSETLSSLVGAHLTCVSPSSLFSLSFRRLLLALFVSVSPGAFAAERSSLFLDTGRSEFANNTAVSGDGGMYYIIVYAFQH